MPKTPKKTPQAKTKAAAPIKPPRVLKGPKYSSFKLQKRIKPPQARLLGSFRLFAAAVVMLKKFWKPFLGMVIVYGILNILLVKGFSAGASLTDTKHALTEAVGGSGGQLVTGVILFSYLVGSSGNTTSQSAGLFQVVLIIIVSLAFIWTLRQVYAGNKTRIRDGFYKGMYPLIPFVLILLVICLQLIPFAIGAFVYSLVTTVAVSGVELIAWAVLFFLLSLLTLYMLTSSLFALYIVCLPDMQPLQALRSARELVRYRRWSILRKILFLPFALFIIAAVVMIPLIIVVPVVASWAFFAVGMVFLAIAHGYMYRLYRELL